MDVYVNSGFGNRLRLLRLSRELSQSQLARSIGRHQTAIGPYERGEYMPARDIVERLAQILETSPEYLLFGRSPHRSQIEIGGRIDAGGAIINTSETETHGPIALDEARLIAFQINDLSMTPAFEKGDFALVLRTEPELPDALLGQNVLAELPDGRQFIRKLLPSAQMDHFDLAAINAPCWHDIAVKRVHAVVGSLSSSALIRPVETNS